MQVPLFCACMGGIMYYLEHEPDTMAPLLRGLIRRFLASRISNPTPPSNRNASYTYLHTLDAMKEPKRPEIHETETLTAEKYNLESIPGLWATFWRSGHVFSDSLYHFILVIRQLFHAHFNQTRILIKAWLPPLLYIIDSWHNVLIVCRWRPVVLVRWKSNQIL